MIQAEMALTPDEKEILQGSQGPVMQKVLQTIVAFGSLFGAKRLVPLDGPIHFVNTTAIKGLDVVYKLLDELIAAGIQTKEPFTSDPWPMDFENIKHTDKQKEIFMDIYGPNAQYKDQLLKLGLRDETSFSCACYLPETGNIPKPGQILAWAESQTHIKPDRSEAVLELAKSARRKR